MTLQCDTGHDSRWAAASKANWSQAQMWGTFALLCKRRREYWYCPGAVSQVSSTLGICECNALSSTTWWTDNLRTYLSPTFLDIYLTRMLKGRHTEPEHYKVSYIRFHLLWQLLHLKLTSCVKSGYLWTGYRPGCRWSFKSPCTFSHAVDPS